MRRAEAVTGLEEGVYVVGTGSTGGLECRASVWWCGGVCVCMLYVFVSGIAETFLTLGLVYSALMCASAAIYRSAKHG